MFAHFDDYSRFLGKYLTVSPAPEKNYNFLL